LLGLASNGVHSNGFSLVRKIVEDAGLDYDAPAPFAPDRSLAESLLDPTRIYVRSCLDGLRAGGLKGLSHITGGGLIDNPPRVLPAGVAARIDTASWPLPPVFGWLAQAGELPASELARSFNCGIGMIAIATPERSTALAELFTAAGETVYAIGEIIARTDGEPAVRLEHTDAAWPA
jgi:phosphoribosylformylglycinamidine cyclo-ligase